MQHNQVLDLARAWIQVLHLPTITNCTFSGNGETYSFFYYGSGISISGSSSPAISNCEFSQNVAGGIYCSSSSGTISISDCEFSSNSSGTGGAIDCFNSSPTISDCVFTGNGADGVFGDGGAIECFNSSPTISDCVFTGNTADGDGGAIYCVSSSSPSSSSPTIERCVFSGNTAEDDGGGFYSLHSTPTLINCLFIENEAENGGGIATKNSNSSTVINCTFYANASLGTYSDRGGGAVYAKASSFNYCSTTLTNCILWGNTAANDGHEVCCDGASAGYKAIVTLEYCDIQDTTDWSFKVEDSYAIVDYLNNYNIYDDPDFESVGNPKGIDNEWATSDDGFALGTTDCIDNGDDVTNSPDYIGEDITGNSRKINYVVDIGAYEYGN